MKSAFKPFVKMFDVVPLQQRSALESYFKVPMTVTAVRHANKSDDSEFHCFWQGIAHDTVLGKQSTEGRPYCIKKVFLVPMQKIQIRLDAVYGMFYAIRVKPQFKIPIYPGKEYYLIAQMSGQSGFLVPLEEFEADEEKAASEVDVCALA